MIRYHGNPSALSLWPSSDEELDCRPLGVSPTPASSPLSVFAPFWARPGTSETLPTPVTITYREYTPVPSDDDSDYLAYEDEDANSFVEDREAHPLKKVLSSVAAFWRRLFT